MRILFLQFDAGDGPGRLGAGLAKNGAMIDVARLYAGDHVPPLEGYDALVALGGEMNAFQDDLHPFLPDAVTALQEAHRRSLPTLGVCLGGQLLARALGAQVRRKAATEVGYFPIALTAPGLADPLFAGWPDQPLTFQWHEDAFDLPDGATLLADSPRDSLQAYRHGLAYGIQFHPEVDPHMLAVWIRGGGAVLPYAATPTSEAELLATSHAVDEQFARQTEVLCANLAAMIQVKAALRPASAVAPR
jgi:GMP synthase-like glutamine amidotransferase